MQRDGAYTVETRFGMGLGAAEHQGEPTGVHVDLGTHLCPLVNHSAVGPDVSVSLFLLTSLTAQHPVFPGCGEHWQHSDLCSTGSTTLCQHLNPSKENLRASQDKMKLWDRFSITSCVKCSWHFPFCFDSLPPKPTELQEISEAEGLGEANIFQFFVWGINRSKWCIHNPGFCFANALWWYYVSFT